MIRLGIVGINYGKLVHLPAFRADARCEVAAFAGSNAERTADAAKAAGVPKSYGNWRALVDDKDIDAISIATMPALQAEIAIAALKAGKPVFAEKPMASTLSDARVMLQAANDSGLPTGLDFNFTEIMAWHRAKSMLDTGAIGRLRHIAVHWHVENYAIQMRMKNWKTLRDDGGGVLGNFISHCFHYLEWFAGPIAGLSARVSGLPGDADLETTVAMAMQFQSGAACSLGMSCASFRGTGHHVEFFGEDGTLMLHNPTADYMRGFALSYAKRPGAMEQIPVDDPADAPHPDGRIAPVSRLATKFFDAIEGGPRTAPGFTEGFRVQRLIDAAKRANADGKWLDFAAENAN